MDKCWVWDGFETSFWCTNYHSGHCKMKDAESGDTTHCDFTPINIVNIQTFLSPDLFADKPLFSYLLKWWATTNDQLVAIINNPWLDPSIRRKLVQGKVIEK